MSALTFEVLDARAEPYAAVPTIMFRLRVTESSGTPVHAVALRCQIRIEPNLRRYNHDEETRLVEVFGEPPHWGQSLKPFLWTHVETTITGFDGSTEIDLPVTCTYDLEVAGTKFFHSCCCSPAPRSLAVKPASRWPRSHGTKKRRTAFPSGCGAT
jgi:Family of unknown function (DUF6084)